MEREQALELLQANHTFPGPFQFRVVVRPPAAAGTITAMVAAAGPGARAQEVEERLSKKGTYVALHVTIELQSADKVLDVYEILGTLDDVVAKL